MKTLELDTRLPGWVNAVLNRWPFAIHRDAVATIFTIAYDAEGWYRPENVSLYYNGYFFIRIMWPVGIWIHVKPHINLRLQGGLGYALNGRLKATFRKQTDESAAAGVQGRNV